MMIKHFVTFYSPGTFLAESTTKEIESWSTDLALKMVIDIKERHGATPYGFQFSTRERGETDFNSHETEKSPLYYLGGEILTLEQVKDRKDPSDKTLISNMECNGWNKIIVNTNSWKWVQPLKNSDVILDWKKGRK